MLTALHLGRLRTYAGEKTPGRELAEAEWINTLHASRPHMKPPACAGGHQEPPPPPDPGAEEEREPYLATSGDTRHHRPGEAPGRGGATADDRRSGPPL